MKNHEKENEALKLPRLKVNGEIILHMRSTQNLFNGSWKYSKMGLVQFARMMTMLSKAASQEDPYAEWYLLKTYQALFDAKKELKAIELKLAGYFDPVRGVSITLIANEQALHCPLHFSTPFGFIGANLLAEVDYVLRQLVTLKRIGSPLPENITEPTLVAYVQRAFSLARHWHSMGITRRDIHDNSEKYQKANALMGDIPDAVLKKEIEFSLMPKRKK